MIDIERINYLARKSRQTGLTEAEKCEQAILRREYIDSVKSSLEAQLANTFVVDEDGNKHPLSKKEDNN